MQLPINKKADLYNQDIQKTFTLDSVDLLSLDISYPQIRLNQNRPAQKHMNAYYLSEAKQFYQYASSELKQGAIETYHSTQKNGFPFLKQEALMKYTVPMNQRCLLSSYFDQYTFTGGAHGNTIRSSVNWDLQTGTKISMEDLFNQNTILDFILHDADQKSIQNQFMFFDDYQSLILQHFNPESFYLSPTELSVYFQQYEIGPYASGIIVFEIPYHEIDVAPPGCFLY